MDHIVIGISGGTGSGKTTLAKRISKAFGGDALLVSMDCYYKDHNSLPFEERAKTNYDHPDAYDVELITDHIKALRRGESIMHPTYDFTKHLRCEEWERADSAKVIIVEGILVFAIPEIVELLDIKIFVDTDADVRIVRRITRDVKERGRNLDSVIKQYLTTVKPMHEHFVEPSKRLADVIVPEGGHNEVAYNMIVNAIHRKINNE